MTAVNRRLSYLRPASTSCVHVSMLLSDAHNVVRSARQLQIFQSKLSSRVRNVIKSVLSSCLGPGSRQEIFLSIKFTSLRPRNGSRRTMANLTAPESALAGSDPVLTRTRMFRWRQSLTPSARNANQQPVLTLQRGRCQCQMSLYLYIECTSLRMSLPAFSGRRAAHVRCTHIACRILVKIAFRARA